jgi:hypothetical protein
MVRPSSISTRSSPCCSKVSTCILLRFSKCACRCGGHATMTIFAIAPVRIVRGSRPGKTVNLTEQQIRGLCIVSREIFLSQPILLELEAPLKVCGTFSHSSSLQNDMESLPLLLFASRWVKCCLFISCNCIWGVEVTGRFLTVSVTACLNCRFERLQVTFTVNITIFCACSSMAASLPRQTTCSSATTSIVANRQVLD